MSDFSSPKRSNIIAHLQAATADGSVGVEYAKDALEQLSQELFDVRNVGQFQDALKLLSDAYASLGGQKFDERVAAEIGTGVRSVSRWISAATSPYEGLRAQALYVGFLATSSLLTMVSSECSSEEILQSEDEIIKNAKPHDPAVFELKAREWLRKLGQKTL